MSSESGGAFQYVLMMECCGCTPIKSGFSCEVFYEVRGSLKILSYFELFSTMTTIFLNYFKLELKSSFLSKISDFVGKKFFVFVRKSLFFSSKKS